MSQLPDAFKGHDLTGWTFVGGAYAARFTNHGYTIELSAHINGTDWMLGDEDGTVVVGSIPECLFQAEVTASRQGGWAPAPIGFDPGWQPIETYPIPPGPTFPAFTGGNSDTGFVGECYWASVGQEFQHYGGPVELTHFKPLPAPPEAKS